jgi:hypothetical protein
MLASYARARRLVDYGIAALARRCEDTSALAREIGTSVGKAKDAVEAGKVMATSAELSGALQQGDVSLEQAAEIARAEEAAPGTARELVEVAQKESFPVLRERARQAKLEAEQHRDLFSRQHAARAARSHTDELGMVNIWLRLQPHVGTPLVNRAEAEAARLYRRGNKEGAPEPFERYLADAYAGMLAGAPVKARSARAELVVLVSHEVTQRGWQDVKEGEVCSIPGVGPVSPQVAKEIAADAFLSGVFFDGVDLRHFVRYSRSVPIEIAIALQLGEPPGFAGVRCTDCGNRFRPERDHLDPRVAGGPTATTNLKWRCHSCHEEKTQRDRKAGKLKPRAPGEERGPPGG